MEINTILILVGYAFVVLLIVKMVSKVVDNFAFAVILFVVLFSFPFWDIIQENKFSYEEYKLSVIEKQVNISVEKVKQLFAENMDSVEELTE